MKLYFVRHGESIANMLGEFSNNNYKHPLTDLGIAQAHALTKNLSGLAVKQVYSSPVLRAVQTALILAESLHASLSITDALREWSVGIYEGTTDPAGWALHRQVQEDWYFRNKLDSKMPGGESFLEIKERFVTFMDTLVQDQSLAGQEVVLVGHGGLYLAMLPTILKNVDFTFAHQHGFPYTGYVEAETRHNSLYGITWCGIPLNSE